MTHSTLTERGHALMGKTFKIKTPHCSHALYLTINNISKDNGANAPFEMFIQTKDMESYMWINALTRMVSLLLRSNIPVEEIVKELKFVFDPRGGYYKKGGLFMSSIVAEIGSILEGVSSKPSPDGRLE